MLLQEEYLKRHGLTVPVVNHTLRDGCLLVRSKMPEKYFPNRYIIDFRWVDEGNHPGNYHITYYKCGDGLRREQFCRFTDPSVVPYDEYEPYLYRWLENQKSCQAKSATNYNESIAFMWELFLYAYDSWIAKSAGSTTLQKVEMTIDTDLDSDKKVGLINDALISIGKDSSQMMERWDHYFLPYAKKNFYWLARMLNGE
jgi:hypothetical protein